MKKRLALLGFVLALTAMLAFPFAAFADTTGVTGTWTGGTNTSTFTAPTAIGFGGLTEGSNTGNSATPGTVMSGKTGWTLSVADANSGTNTGHMTTGGDNTVALAAALNVGLSSGSGTIAAYATAISNLATYGAIGTTSIPLYAEQTVALSDLNGSYSLTLNWTFSPAT